MSHRIIADKTIDLENGNINVPIDTPLETDPALFYTLALLRHGYKIELHRSNGTVFKIEFRHGDIRLRRDMSNKVKYIDTTTEFPNFFSKSDWDIYILD